MADKVDKATRSRIMAAIKGRDTKPEMVVRKALFERGYRYRLHRKDLAGKPDLTFPKYKAVIFVHGCFWHGHDCFLFRQPSSNKDYWENKIASNLRRDGEVIENLLKANWRVLTIWECSIYRKDLIAIKEIIDSIENCLNSGTKIAEIRATKK